ncbi:hypothetical protein E4T66_06485 [Sinimarinibacterium sp. CAU 1509]|uniref:hypothetical protein n=1 Tax=Sinimarinibacterium sp. CAU 1509 TaxID=2562283 RepID=UPI0010AD1682|nr:hypothetical protein [Sinimarinibacterium sp. CAU 1509]TJY61893.1 hypothetical protein E4T66_06485 [Sinimarinibacterium sp. CAU 1509]
MVHGWPQRADAAASVWLVCGTEDRFISAAQLMAPQLPSGHFLALPGGHAWTVWSAGARTVFAQQVAALERP